MFCTPRRIPHLSRSAARPNPSLLAALVLACTGTATPTIHAEPQLGATLPLGGPGHQSLDVLRRRAAVAPDVCGGAYVAWRDEHRLRLQRITAEGHTLAGWPDGGMAISSPHATALVSFVVADGAGGALVAWVECTASASPPCSELIVQRIAPDGSVARGWPSSGLRISAQMGVIRHPVLTEPERGRFLVAWRQQDLDGGQSIRLQKLGLSGQIGIGWPEHGLVVDGEWGLSDFPEVIADGAGGALVAWRRSGETAGLLMLRRITADGSVAKGWPARGLLVAAETFPREFLPTLEEDDDRPLIAGDGKGGAYVVWASAEPAGDRHADLNLQRVTGAGDVARGWPARGLPIAAGPGDQCRADLLSDGEGGLYLSWLDEGGESATRLTRLGPDGRPRAGWKHAVAFPSHYGVTLARDGPGVLVSWLEVVWTEADGARFRPHLQRIQAEPSVATTSIETMGDDRSCAIHLTAIGDGCGGALAVWQEIPREADQQPGFYKGPCAVLAGRFRFEPPAPVAGTAFVRAPIFALLPPHPNPTHDLATIEFEIPKAGLVEVAVFDVAGRVVRHLARNRPMPPGAHRLVWDLASRAGHRVGAAVYFVRVKAGGNEATQKLVVTR